MKTLDQEWRDFERRVISPTAPAVQREEMELAFFAGVWLLLGPDADSPWRQECHDRCVAIHHRLEARAGFFN